MHFHLCQPEKGKEHEGVSAGGLCGPKREAVDTICTDALLERTQPCVIFLPAATRRAGTWGLLAVQRSREGFYWLVSYHRAIYFAGVWSSFW